MLKFLISYSLVFLLTFDVFAQNGKINIRKKSIWINANAGILFKKLNVLSSDNSIRNEPSGGEQLGISLEYRFSRNIGLEAGFASMYNGLELQFVTKDKNVIYWGWGTNSISLFPVNMIGRVNVSRERAFLVGKLGLAYFHTPTNNGNMIFNDNNLVDQVVGTIDYSTINEKGFLLNSAIGLEGRFLRKGNIRLMFSHGFSIVNVMQANYTYTINNEPQRTAIVYSKLRNTGVSVHVSFPLLSFGKEKNCFK